VGDNFQAVAHPSLSANAVKLNALVNAFGLEVVMMLKQHNKAIIGE
jgi:hypothetical protein